MKKVMISAAISAALAASSASASSALTESEVTKLMAAWGDGIVKIGSIYTEGGDYKSAAEAHIKEFYAFGESPVLFKPTLASADQFRGTFGEAMSYFVGGEIAEDGGFAIAPYTNVRWENEGTLVSGETAMAMGNYFFTKTDGSEVKVEYTFGVERMEDGSAKFVLHHSSLPFSPS